MPAAYPNLLVNGACRHRGRHGHEHGRRTTSSRSSAPPATSSRTPTCSLDDLMKFVPGPDLPSGGKIVGLDGIRDAYLTGRGTLPHPRHRRASRRSRPAARASSSPSCPTSSARRRSSSKIKDLVQSKKLQGIADVKDLTDRQHGLRLVIEIKNGFHPEAVLEQLYRLTPMEESFGINNVALVDGQPRTLGLKELLPGLRRLPHPTSCAAAAEYRLRKREERLHLVEGLLVAILDIDEVIQLIRTSDDAATARARLIDGLRPRPRCRPSYILELRLRRLTKFSRIELETEQATSCERAIEELDAHPRRREAAPAARLRRARRRRQGPRHPAAHGAARVGRATAGRDRDARSRSPTTRAGCCSPRPACSPAPATPTPMPAEGAPRQARRHRRCRAHDGAGRVRRSSRRPGRMVRLSALDLPTLPPTDGAPSLSGGAPLAVYVDLPAGRGAARRSCRSTPTARVLALGTAQGVVKRVTPDVPRPRRVGGHQPQGRRPRSSARPWLRDGDEDLVFITSDAQLLRFPASAGAPAGSRGRRHGRHQALRRGAS